MNVGLWKNRVKPPNTTMIVRLTHNMVSTLRCLTQTMAICANVATIVTAVAIRMGACVKAMLSPSHCVAKA